MAATPLSVMAEPGGKGKHKHKHERHGGHSARFAGGPPPWAPAHGYRARHGTPAAALPLDIDIGRCNREVIGQILGGAAGAAAGSQIGDGRGRIVAIVGGTIAGVLLGGEIGRAMDRTDQLCVDQALEQAPDGQVIAWTDPDRGVRYAVTPQDTWQTDAGRYCREYTAQGSVGGGAVQTFGTACRQPDGSWRLMN
jgi:surface antigen